VSLLDPVCYPGAIKAFAKEVCRNDLLNFGRLHFFFPDSRLALDLNTDKTLKVDCQTAGVPSDCEPSKKEKLCAAPTGSCDCESHTTCQHSVITECLRTFESHKRMMLSCFKMQPMPIFLAYQGHGGNIISHAYRRRASIGTL
jgi:hypothetical protein